MTRGNRTSSCVMLGFLSAGGLSVLAVWILPVPLAWIGFFWALALLFVAMAVPNGLSRKAVLVFAALAAALGLGEAALAVCCPVPHYEVEPAVPKPIRRDDVLGYAPLPSHHWIRRKLIRDRLVFSAGITTDRDGLRIMPPAENATGSILLFGGSFTFGGAVNDGETLGWQMGRLTRGRLRVHTFAFDGYGPHQMLAAIEAGRVDSVVRLRPRFAMYQLITGHPLRAAGRAFWDLHGPRYVLKRDGSVVRRGNFDDGFWSWQHLSGPLIPLLKNTQLGTRWLGWNRRASREELELTAAILARSRDLLRARWPGLELHIVFWPWKEPMTTKVRTAVEGRGFKLIPMTDLLPPSRSFSKEYQVQGDGHPNANCNREMAISLVKRFLHRWQEPPAAGSPEADN